MSDLIHRLDPRRRLVRWRARAEHRALVRRGWYDPAARSQTAAVFIGGAPRSGTTLVRELLDRHSSLACGVETAMLVPAFDLDRIAERCAVERRQLKRLAAGCANLVEFADRFFGELAAGRGKARWVDKAPWNVRVVAQLLDWFPNGRFLHVVRDGRDVVCSLRHHPREALRRGTVVPVRTSRPVAACAETWVQETSLGIAHRGHPRYREIVYERLVTEPEAELRAVCEFLGEEFSPALLDPAGSSTESWLPGRLLNARNAAQAVSPACVGRWRQELDRSERVAVARVAGELLAVLGYCLMTNQEATMTSQEWADDKLSQDLPELRARGLDSI